MTDQSKIIEKLQKLLNMTEANGCSEDEAETAMRLAAILAAREGIELDALRAKQDPTGAKRTAKSKRVSQEFKPHQATPRMKQLMEVLEQAPGAQPDNAWGVLQAATYYVDHVAGKSNDRRLTQAWFGKGAGQKEKVLELLLAA